MKTAQTRSRGGRPFIFSIAVLLATSLQFSLQAEESLPVGSHPTALATPHFPDRLHAFVWRNWQLIEPQRLGEVVGTSAENINRLAESMGLPLSGTIPPQIGKRGYITLIRRNWHLLPYNQLLVLLEMTSEQLAFSLREDDFLFIKLGQLKPKCGPLQYREPNAETRKRAAEIRQLVEQHFGEQLTAPAQPRFAFIDQLSQFNGEPTRPLARIGESTAGVRFIYSYFGVFGDPLSDPANDPYPDGLLSRLANVGVNGVWLHVVLRQLAPGGEQFPEFGEGHEKRLATLRQLVDRCKGHGIDVYLYMNEPRAMPSDFFSERPEMKGVTEGNFAAMCTSNEQVRNWLSDSLAHLFREVPDLGGVFTITASENLTSCASHFRQADCPRCRDRSEAEIIAEVNATIEEGVHRGNPNARVICWDWGWNRHGEAPETIAQLPERVELMSVSEWALPIERGGVRSKVGEYSISAVGPGPRAKREWSLARARGLKTVAKMQLNITWELSAVPFLPVLDLVAEHCQNLTDAEVDGMMLSWTLGGYPSPNLQVAHRFSTQPEATVDGVLGQIATERYGVAATSQARLAWTKFSQAFREYPYSGNVLYRGPQQLGPANLLYEQPTGYSSTMVGIPYDDIDGWRSPYPAEVFATQFEKIATGWTIGLKYLQQVVATSAGEQQTTARRDLGIATAAQLHFASVANQTRFILARNALLEENITAEDRQTHGLQIQSLIDREIALARELFRLTQQDSRIGYEASNHYYYVPLDLVEKVINCEFLRQRFGE